MLRALCGEGGRQKGQGLQICRCLCRLVRIQGVNLLKEGSNAGQHFLLVTWMLRRWPGLQRWHALSLWCA